jgi:hypothetical protein
MRILVGHSDGKPVYLEGNDLITHVHGMGLSRSGKSMLMLFILMQLVKQRKAFCLIDPHGSLYRDLIGWLVAKCYRQPLILFNPSYEKRIVGFNPVLTPYRDEARIMTKAERLSQQLLKIFGLDNSDQFGNIERWLRAFFYTLLDRDLSICDLKYFLYWEYEPQRELLINAISSETIKADLRELFSTKAEFNRKISSTKNKLQRFTHPQMRRIMGLKENNINLPTVIEKQRSILCNLQAAEDDIVGRENMRALGTLLISEIWELFRKRTKPQEFYLIADEAQEYFTPDLAQILPQSAKRGLHLMLFHQDRGQLTPAIASAIKNAQTKLYFSTEESLKEQRHFTLRRANGETVECESPLLTLRSASQSRVRHYIEYMTQYFMTGKQVDEKLKTSLNVNTPTKKELDPYE